MEHASALASVNWLAVIAATVATFVLGGLWYGPLAGKVWMRASGMTEERARQGNMALTFGLSFALQLVAATVLAMFLGAGSSARVGLMAGLAVGVGWVATSLGVIYLFEQRPVTHWAANAGYMVLAFAIMGVILGAWR